MPSNPRDKVDHKDWLALTYTEAEWAAYANGERVRTELLAGIGLVLSSVWIVLITCLFLSPGVANKPSNLIGVFVLLGWYLLMGILPGGLGIVVSRKVGPGQYYRLADGVWHLRWP